MRIVLTTAVLALSACSTACPRPSPQEDRVKPAAAEPALEITIFRDHSPWRGYTGSAQEEEAGKRVSAVPDLAGLESPEHLAPFAVDGKPLLAIDREKRRVVVSAEHFSDLVRGDATRIEAGQRQVMGTVKSPALRARPRDLVLFLLESQLVETYWHMEAQLRLLKEEETPERYRASFAGHHTYFTNEENEEALSFAVELDKKTGEISVLGE